MTAKEIIVEELKKEGLNIAEDAAIIVAKAIFRVLPKAAAATENKYDDLIIPVIGVLEPKVMELLDGIDKEEG